MVDLPDAPWASQSDQLPDAPWAAPKSGGSNYVMPGEREYKSDKEVIEKNQGVLPQEFAVMSRRWERGNPRDLPERSEAI